MKNRLAEVRFISVSPIRSAMSNPRAACGLRPSQRFCAAQLGVRCSENILHTDILSLFS